MKRAIKWALVIVLAVLAFRFFCFSVLLLCVKGPPITEIQAKDRFTQITGIRFTNEMKVVGFKDNHRGFTGDGEFGIGVKMSEQNIAAIINAVSPLNGKWRKGPVEGEIGFHCAFIYSESPGYGGISSEERYHGGSPEAVDILSSTDAVYCAKQRGPSSRPWHNGTLIVVVPSKATVWLSQWDW